jgi:hypothetical protein
LKTVDFNQLYYFLRLDEDDDNYEDDEDTFESFCASLNCASKKVIKINQKVFYKN